MTSFEKINSLAQPPDLPEPARETPEPPASGAQRSGPQAVRPIAGNNQREADGETILVVEDDPQIRAVLVAFLGSQGYRLLIAGDGVQGLEVAEGYDGAIDVLLTDVEMPRMGGVELAQRVAESRTATKILFLSGAAVDRDTLRRLAASGTEAVFLAKPFECCSLRRRLRLLVSPSAPEGQAPRPDPACEVDPVRLYQEPASRRPGRQRRADRAAPRGQHHATAGH